MKNPESQLLRLLAMARQAPPQPTRAMSPHLQTRVLAHWRSTGTDDEMLRSLHALFRRALVCAAVLMVASIVWSFTVNDAPSEDEFTTATLELSADVLQ
jgi:hypothetical protein